MRLENCPWNDERCASNGLAVSENFLNWFKSSKVVDSSGKPLVVFHGTHDDVAAFDPQCIGNSFGADEKGFFFTSLPSIADFYASFSFGGESLRDGPNVIPCFVSLQNPLVIDASFLAIKQMHPIGAFHDSIGFWDNHQGLILDWANGQGSDGVILVDELTKVKNFFEPIRTVVAFRPEQIKSAIGNSGLYLSNSSLTNHSLKQSDDFLLAQAAKAWVCAQTKQIKQTKRELVACP